MKLVATWVGTLVLLSLFGCAHTESEQARKAAALAGEKVAYVDQLAQFDQRQIQLARLALENSDDLQVRQFARQLIGDHSQHLQMLRGWTEARAAEASAVTGGGMGGGGTAGMEVTGPAMQALTGRIDNYELNAREEDVTSLPQFSKLESKSGGDFDRAFLEQVQKDQEQAAKLTRSGTGKFSEDRVFASMLSRNEPVIQHHIRTAEELKQRQ